jgi:hypothetical protein
MEQQGRVFTLAGPYLSWAWIWYGVAGSWVLLAGGMAAALGYVLGGLVIGFLGVLLFVPLGLWCQRTLTQVDESGVTNVFLRRRHWTWDQVLGLRLRLEDNDGDVYVLFVRDAKGWHRTGAQWWLHGDGLTALKEITAAVAPPTIHLAPTVRRRLWRRDEVLAHRMHETRPRPAGASRRHSMPSSGG